MTSASLEDFVRNSGGDTCLSRILIANNGIAAVKEIRSIRRWAYETFHDDRAISFTVMATPEDLEANAEYIRMADHYIEVPGGTNSCNYANISLIVDVARKARAHAVWAGWGHASENPELPDALALVDPPIVFIGPTSSAMRNLGDKVASTIIAQYAKVPTIAWSGDLVAIDESQDMNEDGTINSISEITYKKALVTCASSGLEAAERIGYPVMIKASEGGGGKGIRFVSSHSYFRTAYEQVVREVPHSPIFLMKVAENARHLEVQLLADRYGNTISLFGRDCSVQRRHQKIIEEAPQTIAPAHIFREMESAAIRLAKLVGYVSCGTVEYLYAPDEERFYFLELNPRLQVEHPCSEMISGVNLPAAQLQIAMGIPLHRIRDIRVLYGMCPLEASSIDFDFASTRSHQVQRLPIPKGHVIAARITAENPDAGFKPNNGAMQELNFRSRSNVWGYFSVGASGQLHQYADSQFGHVFAYGENREQARHNMVVALKELSIRGEFQTTVEFLVHLLETSEFTRNGFHTGWLDTLISQKAVAARPDPIISVLIGATVKASSKFEQSDREFLSGIERGLVLPFQQKYETLVTLQIQGFSYCFSVILVGPNAFSLSINSSRVETHMRKLSDGGILVSIDGRSYTVYVIEEVCGTRVIIDGMTCMLEEPGDPSVLRSTSPGKLVRYLFADGDHVERGEQYAEIEVMKMCLSLVTEHSGIIRRCMQPGSIVCSGDTLATLTLDDESFKNTTILFEDAFPAFGPPFVQPQNGMSTLSTLRNILDGFMPAHDMQLADTRWMLDYGDLQFDTDVLQLLDDFYQVEKEFDSMEDFQNNVLRLRKKYRDDLPEVLRILRAHSNLPHRKEVVLFLLTRIQRHQTISAATILGKISSLRSICLLEITSRCREVLAAIVSSNGGAESTPASLPPLLPDAEKLELHRLSNFEYQILTPRERCPIFLCLANGKESASDSRIFARVWLPNFHGRIIGSSVETELSKVILDVLESLEVAVSRYPNVDCNHMYLNLSELCQDVSFTAVSSALCHVLSVHDHRMRIARVSETEIVLQPRKNGGEVRFHVTNDSGYTPAVHAYTVTIASNARILLPCDSTKKGPYEGFPVDFPYSYKQSVQPKRRKAHLMGTTYVYDFPDLVREALRIAWSKMSEGVCPSDPLSFAELVLGADGSLHEIQRSPGSNTIGMVGWLMCLRTPEYPEGRPAMVVANDITFQIGSFGPAEDDFFYKCSEMARAKGCPRIYLSANSGARIGVAEEIRDLFQIAWRDDRDLSQGIDYLYLDEADMKVLADRCGGREKISGVIKVEKCQVFHQQARYRISSIIGMQDGIGVENLCGSGLIAGETAKAYRDVFTITLVSCRSVGIGAYLVRLGQRAIQNVGHPIILTGSAALNKVIGKEVYGSNLQLGGHQIMHANGVSHRIVQNDLEGICQILNWLSFVPRTKGARLPICKFTTDPVDREIAVDPIQANNDPIALISGVVAGDEWASGLFDRGSFFETLTGWAKTVRTGRARLGGIPIGVITVETLRVETIIPADPANADSCEQVVHQAGQVWYPDSAFKTAQTIRDLNFGEELPLFILANWRGFSGGMNDMFHAVLKFGSMIVDALTEFRKPVFIYLPPHSQLRGGAWVVLDSSINKDCIEMFADPTSRAGVLEPEGLVEIKFRRKQILQLMERTDAEYRHLLKRYEQDRAPSTLEKIMSRENALLPLFHQAALLFADLHDTPQRMKSKGAIQEVVDWKTCRPFFYWRLRRRLVEQHTAQRFPGRNLDSIRSLLRSSFKGSDTDFANDKRFVKWYETSGSSVVEREQRSFHKSRVKEMILDSELSVQDFQQILLELQEE